jgi:hypothetical protein
VVTVLLVLVLVVAAVVVATDHMFVHCNHLVYIFTLVNLPMQGQTIVLVEIPGAA